MLDDEGWGDNQERHEAEAVADVRPVEAGPGVGGSTTKAAAPMWWAVWAESSEVLGCQSPRPSGSENAECCKQPM